MSVKVITKFTELEFNQLLLKERKNDLNKKQRWRFAGNLNGRPLSRVKWSGARAAAAVTRAAYLPDRDSQHFFLRFKPFYRTQFS